MFHFSELTQMGKLQLPQRFKHTHGNGIAQVQGTGLLPHGDADAVGAVCLQKVLRQPPRFPSEEEEAAVPIIRLGIASRRLGGKQAHLPDGIAREQLVQIFVNADIHQMPVVQPRPADGPAA